MQLPAEFLKFLNELQGRMQKHKTKHGKCQKNLQMVLVLTGMLGFFLLRVVVDSVLGELS